MDLILVKENDKGRIYQGKGIKLFYRIKGSISGDNSVNTKELIYFIEGSAKITLKDKTWEISSPAKVEFPEKTFHKIEALTDISFVLIEEQN